VFTLGSMVPIDGGHSAKGAFAHPSVTGLD
jgi:hypothetical protein